MSKVKHKFGDAKTVIGCIRVSKEEQSLGAEAQAQALERYCTKHGLNLVAVFSEELTGTTPLDERHGLTAALAALREHNAGILLFSSRDRFSRTVLLTKLIEREAIKNGAMLVAADGKPAETPQDQLFDTIMDAAGEYEREVLVLRIKNALAVKKTRGEYVGGLPYGYEWRDGVLVENPAEQAVIAEAKRLRDEGMSYTNIARNLPFRSRRNKPFRKTQVMRMLES